MLLSLPVYFYWDINNVSLCCIRIKIDVNKIIGILYAFNSLRKDIEENYNENDLCDYS